MSDFNTWERFDENFDSSDGGALYVREQEYDECYDVAGVLWLDGGSDDLHYFAFTAQFQNGDEVPDYDIIDSMYTAADAFSGATDAYVNEEIGWFQTMDEAVQAVGDAVESYLA